MTMSLLALLDEIRSIGQLGLNFSDNPYDRERYERLLRIASGEYAAVSGLPEDDLEGFFRRELGYITPKVGCAGAVFNDDGHLLLIKRSDNGKWGLPGGYAEVNLSPEENLHRELHEETGMEVEIISLVNVYHVLPGEYSWQPYTVYSLVYLCRPIGGELTPSHETLELGFFDLNSVTDWYGNHSKRAQDAYTQWLEKREIR
jgi:ADP-ribose pyrophosphatase YjhB (NUDIX family)